MSELPVWQSNSTSPVQAVPEHGRLLVWAVVLGACLVIAFQGTRGLYESTEGRYAECARETLRSGDLDDPILNGELHWSKPPLTYMAIMGGTAFLGDNPWGVRAYLVLAFIAAVAATGWAGTVLWGRQAGGLAALIVATCPFLAGAAHVVTTDMLVVTWAALAVAAFWHAWVHRSPVILIMSGLFLGLGMMTKGPVALLVPLCVMAAAWPGLRRTTPEHFSWPALMGAVSVFLLVGLAWYVIEASHHAGLLGYWVGKELIARNTSDTFHRHPEFRHVLTMYVPLLLGGSGAWLPLVLWRSRVPKAGKAAEVDGPVQRIAWRTLMAAIVLPFVLFSVSPSKLPMYLAPLFVPISLLLGRQLNRLIEQRRLGWKLVYGCAGFMALLIVIGKGVYAYPERSRDMTRLAARLAPIMAEEPGADLFSVGGRPLNGLEFHLHRGIEAVPAATLGDHLVAHGSEPRPSLYLISARDSERISSTLPGQKTVMPVGPYWVLLRLAGLSDAKPPLLPSSYEGTTASK